MKENRICLHLLGEQPVPIYLGAINIEAKKHILLSTEKTKNVAKNIKEELIKNDYEVEIINLEENDNSVITSFEKLSSLYSKILNPIVETNEIFFNATGGTKIMSSAIYYVLAEAKYINVTPFYVETREKRLIYLAGKDADKPIVNLLNIDNFLGIAGYKDNQQREVTIINPDTINIEIAEYFAKHCSENLVELRSKVKKYNDNNSKKDAPDKEMAMGHKIKKYFPYVYDLTEKYKCFSFASIDKIIRGAWLDLCTYTRIIKKNKDFIEDIRIDIEVIAKSANYYSDDLEKDKQEMDIMYTDGFNLYCVECKTSIFKNLGQKDIQTLENVARKIGGSFSKGAFVTSEYSPYETGDSLHLSSVEIKIDASQNVAGFLGLNNIYHLVDDLFGFKPKTLFKQIQKKAKPMPSVKSKKESKNHSWLGDII